MLLCHFRKTLLHLLPSVRRRPSGPSRLPPTEEIEHKSQNYPFFRPFPGCNLSQEDRTVTEADGQTYCPDRASFPALVDTQRSDPRAVHPQHLTALRPHRYIGS